MAGMHVVILNDYAHVNGGGAKVALESAVALARMGKRVQLLAAVGPVDPILHENGVEVICLDQPDILNDTNRVRASVKGLWNRKAARALRRILSGCSAEDTVVHAHGWLSALSSAPLRVAQKMGFQVVLTMHAYFLACPNGSIFNFRQQAQCPLKPLSPACILTNCDKRSYAHKVWRVVRMVFQKLGGIPGKLETIISLSDFSEAIMKPFLPAAAQIVRVRNPIDTVRGNPAAVDDQSAIVFIGRMELEKGVHLFAQALGELGLESMCIGDGALRKGLQKKYPGIEYTGWLSPSEIRERLKKARCLVFPSVVYETGPLVPMEAASLGVPAVVSDACAARDQVEDGVSGLHFRSGDVEDLKAKLRRLMEEPGLAGQLGAEAYRRYWADPSGLQEHAESLIEVYERMLERRSFAPA